ncbi:unnamed protein product [Rotaria socialis]|uniref:Uncharacterized protein n=1 Tax=Rotaria socialis TaxID=392032 RepID=A0A821CFW7_9BILA|nr:unnamed protein product [Rotaria socialis]CAF4339365.1 unnamed protein product [Rotaria socialis]CAF4532440.1 unnamed protein product [Rotaria socialis]CAF4607856.1 unnamed protein product [Rotaria socialis]
MKTGQMFLRFTRFLLNKTQNHLLNTAIKNTRPNEQLLDHIEYIYTTCDLLIELQGDYFKEKKINNLVKAIFPNTIDKLKSL